MRATSSLRPGSLLPIGSPVIETRLGVYRHYKGGFYQVSAVAQDTATGLLQRDPEGDLMPLEKVGRRVVVYTALALRPGLRTWVRTEEEFHEPVCVTHGRPLLDCARRHPKDAWEVIPRFEYLGEGFEEWMADIRTEERTTRVS